MTAPVLVIQHEDACPPGLLGDIAHAMGVRLHVWEADHGDRGESLDGREHRPPANLDGYSGLVVLGGRMNAYEDARYPWLSATKNLLVEGVTSGLPTLGLCLGHQLAVVALEGEVEANPHGPTRGVFPVGFTDAGRKDPLLSLLPGGGSAAALPRESRSELRNAPGAEAMHWNSDVVTEAPPGSDLLAVDQRGYPQVLRLGENAWGMQCHPELVTGFVGWWRDLTDPASQPGGADALEAAVLDVEEALPRLHAQWHPVLAAFLQLTVDVARSGR